MGVSASKKEKKSHHSGGCDLLTLLRSKADRITGIHDITVLKHMGRDILLIGERHNREGSCDNARERTVQINAILEDILKTQDNIDFFIEGELSIRDQQGQVDGAMRERLDLGGLREIVRDLQVSNQLPPNSRVHYTDVRDMLGCPPYYTVFDFDSSISGFVNRTLFYTGASKFEDIRRLCVEMLKDTYINMIFKTVLREEDGTVDFIPHSLISKQIDKSELDGGDLRQKILPDVLSLIGDWEAAAQKFITEQHQEDVEKYRENLHEASEALSLAWVWVHDIYTLARMFKPYTDCVVFYGGSFHCKKLAEYIVRLGGEVTAEIRSPDDEWSCLSLEGGRESVGALESQFQARLNSVRRLYNAANLK